MDRPIQPEVLRRNAQNKWLKIGGGVAFVLMIFLAISSLLQPKIERSLVRTALVEKGDVDAGIGATGVVVPEVEEIITSPMDSRVLKVLHRAGDTLKSGEPILLLDAGEAFLKLSRLSDQVSLKKNAQEQLRATLQGRIKRLASDIKIKELEVKQNRVKLDQNSLLFEKGIVSKNDLEQASLALERAQAELAQLQLDQENATLSTRLQLEGVELEMNILDKEKKQATDEYERSIPKSQRPGILTFALQTEGVTVRRGETVARVADLSAFRIEASVSDVHSKTIYVGMPAEIQQGTEIIKGHIGSIQPTVENGVVKIFITLDQSKQSSFRSNQRVDVTLIAGKRLATLRVKKGAMITANSKPAVFVVRGSKAIRTEIVLGISNSDYIEILGGLLEGDEIILSDMKEYAGAKEISIK
ncbi:MAG: HlyD family efflux transporter periplasmic adaptor subunit [Chloroherpetonaceae bacterium]|nr:HlyD family efflux transporter periplasmic adaptor subunit [Chloroherpetonaceae bacterium]